MLKELLFDVYKNGAIIGLKMAAVVFVIIILIEIAWLAYRYVTDMSKSKDYEKCNRKLFFGGADKLMSCKLPYSHVAEDELCDAFQALVVYTFFGGVASAIWPAVVVYSAIHGLLFLTRSMIRFKKKVYKALENKAYKDHKH